MTPWLRQVIEDARDAFNADCPGAHFLATRRIPYPVAVAAGVGYLPPSYTPPHSDAVLWSVWTTSYLRGRLVFPLSTADGKYIGLQTRSLDPQVKGKDRYQTYVLQGVRGIEPPMFHTEHAARHLWADARWQVVLVEGPIDALAVIAAGEPCVVAVLTGTPSTGVRQWVRRWAGGGVLALLDTDAAGRHGADVLAGTPGLLVSAPFYPTKDPGDLWCQHPAWLSRLVARPSDDDVLAYLRRPV